MWPSAPSFLASAPPRLIVQNVKREICTIHPLVLAHRIQQAAWLNASETLKSCPVPILCLAATRDRLIGSRSAHKIRRIRSDIPIRSIDAPHLLLQTQPAKVWQHIRDFLKLPNISPAAASA